MSELHAEFILCCDATNVLDPDFVEKALAWFDDDRVAAVFGRLDQQPARGVVERWRGRHLFKVQLAREIRHHATLSTWGTVVRSSAVAAVGGYDARLSHTEDADLGARLLAANFDIVYDPQLTVLSIASNTLSQVLERYWRWNAGPLEAVTWRGYRKNVVYAVRAMAMSDVRDRDLLSVPISLLTPHYQFWRSFLGRRRFNAGPSDKWTRETR